VKTNLGHAATAAGVAGVLKILLALRQKKIPPSLNYTAANADVAITDSPFYVNTTLRDWTVGDGLPRRAAISSFGFSGTNAHLVIEESPLAARRSEPRPAQLVVLSAQSEAQLRQQVEKLAAHLRVSPRADLGAVAFTLLAGRRHLGMRFACVARDVRELCEALAQWLAAGSSPRVKLSRGSVTGVRETVAQRDAGNGLIERCHDVRDPAACLEHLSAIAECYVRGERLSYENLFAAGTPRVSLPTYPFAREVYWVEKTDAHLLQRSSATRAMLHPLVHDKYFRCERPAICIPVQWRGIFLAHHVGARPQSATGRGVARDGSRRDCLRAGSGRGCEWRAAVGKLGVAATTRRGREPARSGDCGEKRGTEPI